MTEMKDFLAGSEGRFTFDDYDVKQRIYMECKTEGHNKFYELIKAVKSGEWIVRCIWGKIHSYRPEMILSDMAGDSKHIVVISGSRDIADSDFNEKVEQKKARGYAVVKEWREKMDEGMTTKDVSWREIDEKKKEMKKKIAERKKATKFEDASKTSGKVEDDVTITLTKRVYKDGEECEFIPKEIWYHDIGYCKPVAYAVKNKFPVLLIGDTGSGKTCLLKYLASITNNGYRRVNLNGGITEDDFVGKWIIKDKKMVWVDGVLIDAMKKGYWLVVDEVNGAAPEILFCLHSLLDIDGMVVLTNKDGEVVKPHKCFRFFGAMNPDYSGTHRLNEAFQDRFPITVKVDYPPGADELVIVTNQSGNNDKELIKKMIKVAANARKQYRDEKLCSPFSTRRLIDWARLSTTFSPVKAFLYTVINKIPKEDINIMKDIAAIEFEDESFRNVLEIF